MLDRKLKLLFPDINFQIDCYLQDDGDGPYIRHWYRAESEPTQAELDAVIVPTDAEIKAKIEADEVQRKQDIIDNLPSRQVVENNIDAIANLADAKAFLKKLTTVVYWLAKNTSD